MTDIAAVGAEREEFSQSFYLARDTQSKEGGGGSMSMVVLPAAIWAALNGCSGLTTPDFKINGSATNTDRFADESLKTPSGRKKTAYATNWTES
ncbi:MAG: hypothetical protein LBT81_02115 [Helicobacteraceae bacterium]|nr:hypothetical protein [Helicobacteraceae bacterium]